MAHVVLYCLAHSPDFSYVLRYFALLAENLSFPLCIFGSYMSDEIVINIDIEVLVSLVEARSVQLDKTQDT